jgi:hypothetical protein
MQLLQHFARDKNYAALGTKEAARIFSSIKANRHARRNLAAGVNDDLAQTAVAPNVYLWQ